MVDARRLHRPLWARWSDLQPCHGLIGRVGHDGRYILSLPLPLSMSALFVLSEFGGGTGRMQCIRRPGATIALLVLCTLLRVCAVFSALALSRVVAGV